MENIKVSVILPVYNTEKYLEKCLDSVVNQTLRETEIICVDDGSTDGSPGILQKFAAEDNRIVVCLQENRGVYTARNRAVALARGKYLYFMDSDDILESSALETLCKKAEADDADVICFNGDCFTNDSGYEELTGQFKKSYERVHNYEGMHEGPTLLSKMLQHDEYSVVLWLQFINRNFFVRNRLDFCEGIIHADNLFTYQCMLSAQRAEFLPLQLYRRRMRPNSIMTKKVSFADVYAYFICHLGMKKFYEEREIDSLGDKNLFTPVKIMLSNSRSCYMELSPEERQKARSIPDDLREPFQTLVADVCNKRLKKEAVRQKLLAPFAPVIALKNSITEKICKR